jgi:hypothetical protein
MLVKDLINAMESGQLTGKQLADQYKVSTRTISNKIAGLGYKYDNTNKVYNFIGDDLQAVESIEFSTLFNAGAPAPAATAAPGPKPKTTKKPATTPKNELDAIDKLLAASEKPARVYRGYYFDADILAIIDKSSNKSALINAALRSVFEEKGYL